MKDDPRFSDVVSAPGPAPEQVRAPRIDLYLDDPVGLPVTSTPGPVPVSTGPISLGPGSSEPGMSVSAADPGASAATALPRTGEPHLVPEAPPAPPRPTTGATGSAAPYPYRDRTQRDRVPSPSADTEPEATPDPAAPRPKAARVRRPVPPGWWVLGGVLTLALLVLSWTQWPVRAVNISGNTRVAAPELRRLAGLEGHFGWLYYGAWKARGLIALPWVKTATVTRQFPDTVNIVVTERQPFARWQQAAGQVVLLAEDGAVLPAAPGVNLSGTGALPLIGGWGPPRTADALRLTRALSRYTVQSVTYTPSGFTAKTASGTVWGGDLNTLVKYAGSIGMYPNRQIYIYPWGVSVQE